MGKGCALCGVYTHTPAPHNPSNSYTINGSSPLCVIIRGIIEGFFFHMMHAVHLHACLRPCSCEPERVRLSWCRLYLYHQPPAPAHIGAR